MDVMTDSSAPLCYVNEPISGNRVNFMHTGDELRTIKNSGAKLSEVR